MPLEMVPCPQCGTKNSANKRVCYHCRHELKAAEQEEVKRRVLRPKTPDSPQVPRRALEPATSTETTRTATGKVTVPEKAARPAPDAKKRKGGSALVGATLAQRVQFYRQLYGLLHSGIPIGLALNYLEHNIAFHLRPAMREMAQHVQKGERLSEQMRGYPNLFPEWESCVVHAAEVSGTLPEAMDNIAVTLETELELRHQVNSHTWHLKATAVVFILVLLIVTGVGTGVKPGDIMSAFNFVGESLLKTGLLVAGVIAVMRLWQTWGRTRSGSAAIFAITSRLPIIGPLTKNMMRIRFIRVLEALWRAGVAPMEAVETAARASGSRHVINKVNQSIELLGRGGTLGDVLESTRIFPREGMYLLRAGEHSGSIPEALAKVGQYVQFELESQVKTLPMKAQMLFYALIVPAVLALLIWFYTGYFKALDLF